MIVMPDDISVYNGTYERCDMLVGPCCCGATHTYWDFHTRVMPPATCARLQDLVIFDNNFDSINNPLYE